MHPARHDGRLAWGVVACLLLAGAIGCTPSVPSPSTRPTPSPTASVVTVTCGRLTQRDCDGFIEVARIGVGARGQGLARIAADEGCPIAGTCTLAASAWVAFVYGNGTPPIVGVIRGDPSGQPFVERWAGPLPSLPPV